MSSDNSTHSPLPAELVEGAAFESPAEDRPARILEMVDRMQYAAWHHADRLGLGYADMDARRLMWVLTRLYVRLAPGASGSLWRVRTWPTGFDRHFAYRDFSFRDERARHIASATSAWTLLDCDTRELASMERVLDGHLPDEFLPKRLEFATLTIRRMRAVHQRARVRVGERDLDVNGHVNNVRYIAWALAAVPDHERARRSLLAVDILFRAECFAGDELEAVWARPKRSENRFQHEITRVSDEREVARAVTFWTPPAEHVSS